MQGIRVL